MVEETKLSFPGRIFQIWRYGIGHSELLLRSHHREADQKRIDILFKAVWALHLPNFGRHTSLIIERLEKVNIDVFARSFPDEGRLYRLTSEEAFSYVGAVRVFVRSDDGDHTGLGPFYESSLSGIDLGSL